MTWLRKQLKRPSARQVRKYTQTLQFVVMKKLVVCQSLSLVNHTAVIMHGYCCDTSHDVI